MMALLKLNCERISTAATCATSGAQMQAGTDAVRVLTTCGGGGQRSATAATTLTHHEPHALLGAVTVALARNVPANGGPPSRGGSISGGGQRLCAFTGSTLQPEDVVLLLPAAGPSGGQVVLALAAGAELLHPVLQAVGREAAASAIATMRGLRGLPERQREQAQVALEAAVTRAAAMAGGGAADGIDGNDGAAASGGRGAVVVDASGVLDGEEARRSKRQRTLRQKEAPPVVAAAAAAAAAAADGAGASAEAAGAARPPLPRRGARGSKQAEVKAGTGKGGMKAGAQVQVPLGAAAQLEGDAGSAAQPAGSDSELDLDRERAEIMERNRRKLMALHLPRLVSGLAAVTSETVHGGGSGAAKAHRQPSQRGVGAKRSREGSQEPPPPRRVSLRQRGVEADRALAAGIDHETSAGVQLVAGRQALEAARGRQAGEPEGEKARHPKGELPFRSENGNEASDAAFLTALKATAQDASSPPAAASPAAAEVAGGGRASRRQRSGADVSASSGASAGAAGAGASGKVLARLSLADRDVAKVTKDAVTHMAWLPGSERLLMAAADKSGRVSLWDVDVAEGGPAADMDGVLMFAPHSEYVSGMRWLGRDAAVGPCRLITTSYDGSLRALDLGGAGTWLELPAPGDPRDAEFSALEVAPDGRTAFLGDPLGNLDVVDLRAPPSRSGARSSGQQRRLRRSDEPAARSEPGPEAGAGDADAVAAGPVGGLHIRDRKINSLHLDSSSGHLLATSCSDGTVCVWDVRTLTSAAAAGPSGPASSGGSGGRSGQKVKPLSLLRHAKSCHAAYWAEDGSRRLLSTSYDDTIRIWSDPSAAAAAAGSHFALALCIPHNNQTGRWITPFRAVWNAACDAVLVGNMRRGLDIFAVPVQSEPCSPEAAAGLAPGKAGSGAGKLLRTLVSCEMTAIPSRAACHPTLPVVVAATSSGRCHVWR